jgi:hypothetical protein
MRASINNGSSFMSASGDYYFISGLTGAKTNETEIAFHSSAGTSGVYGGITIEGFGLAAPNQITASNALGHFIATTSALNAIRIFGTNGALNSGTIYLLGLPGV